MAPTQGDRIHDANWALRRLSNKAARVSHTASRHALEVWADDNWQPMHDWTRGVRPSPGSPNTG